MDLALDQQRIEFNPAIVDDLILHQRDHARLGIDLNLADMTAVGEIAGVERIGRDFAEARFHPGRQVRHIEGGDTGVGEAHGAVRAGDHERAVLKRDVLRRRLQQMSRDLEGLGDDLVRRLEDRAGSDGRRARAPRSGAVGDRIGVSLDHLDETRIQAQLAANDLLVNGLVALPVARRADKDL